MAKEKTMYVCDNCGQESAKWIGKCPSCGQWNTFKEIRLTPSPSLSKRGAPLPAGGGGAIPLSEIQADEEPRIDMRDEELNRVLGGGLVPGSLVLLGGEPGIGKSTLVLQTILRLTDKKVLYVSGEESARQLKLRADRLGIDDFRMKNDEYNEQSSIINHQSSIKVVCDTSLENIFQYIEAEQPDLVIIDSIQTIATESVESSPGSLSQIRECAAALLKYVKGAQSPLSHGRGAGGEAIGGEAVGAIPSIILIGHITKEGTLAGPKVLEHIVDTVLQFEGDQHYLYRILRSQKNRFGSTSELGIYEMRQDGLRPVANPSELLLTDNQDGLSGIAIAAAIEGVRPFLIETQALVSTAAYGTAQRSANGFDYRRLNMLLAVLEKRVGFKLAQKDVFLNIAGGLRVTDPAIDLGVIAAILSSNVDTAIEAGVALCGEVGLSGEIRPVSRIEQRIAEAQKLGFQRILIPTANLKAVNPHDYHITIVPCRRVEDAFRALFG
ncbi:MAG: DNA repair protein RadA [Bacteroidaceae bacterium]|nr:DNA repair protein RadA [Bacteroidaceae bacterium]